MKHKVVMIQNMSVDRVFLGFDPKVSVVSGMPLAQYEQYWYCQTCLDEQYKEEQKLYSVAEKSKNPSVRTLEFEADDCKDAMNPIFPDYMCD